MIVFTQNKISVEKLVVQESIVNRLNITRN